MRAPYVSDSITNDQNRGIPCKHCGFEQGHKVSCRILSGVCDMVQDAIDKAEAKPTPSLTTFDKALLYVLGISLEGDNRNA
jgi:hypothetical protein